MPDLLLELFSEEIPARMQKKAAADLKKRVTDALVDAGLTYEAATEYWTPRRLTLDLRGLTARSADIRDERKGPKVDAPDKAIEGFLRGAGLSSRDEAEIHSDPKKGEFYVAVINKPGRAADEIIADVMPEIIRSFPWPKSMRWGDKSADAGSMRWVRPLQSILCTFGPETEEPVVVDFEVGGVRSSNITYGHRFHAPDAIIVRRFGDYVAALEKAKVVLSAERRQEIILSDSKNLAFAQGLELVEDAGLLAEVANLVEWPVVLMGEFDESFLDIPDEVVQLTIRTNQKCFVLRGANGALTNRFLLVSNIEANDGGVEVAKGNGKVVAARLSDAKFFWESDLATIKKDKFDTWIKKLDSVTFHAKLGTQGERVQRIAALAKELAPAVGADPELAAEAAMLAKADLGSAMIYEFPEVQGLMGRYYAERAGKHASVSRAVEEHYKPQGPSDDVPSDPVSIAVALADKLDTLVGFWAIDEKPTGSKDPFALRRAALGVIRLVLENGVRLDFNNVVFLNLFEFECVLNDVSKEDLDNVSSKIDAEFDRVEEYSGISKIFAYLVNRLSLLEDISDHAETLKILKISFSSAKNKTSDLLSFFHDRLKVYLRDQGARHDLIDAVLSNPSSGPSGHLLPQGEKEVGGKIPQSSSTPKGEKEVGGKIPQSSSTPKAKKEDGGNISEPLSSPLVGEGGSRSETGEGSNNDDLLMIVRRVEALQQFLETDDGANLVAGTKRAANILAAEEKKGTKIATSVDKALFKTDEERALFDSLEEAENFARMAIEQEDFAKAMGFLSNLRAPVDNFFENVMVNDDDLAIRANRLALMQRIKAATETVADFSKISG